MRIKKRNKHCIHHKNPDQPPDRSIKNRLKNVRDFNCSLGNSNSFHNSYILSACYRINKNNNKNSNGSYHNANHSYHIAQESEGYTNLIQKIWYGLGISLNLTIVCKTSFH